MPDMPSRERAQVAATEAGTAHRKVDNTAADTQRDIDKRMASWFSTSSEHAAYNKESVRELYKQAR